MALFQQSVLRKYSTELLQSEPTAKWHLLKTLFYDPVKQQNIRAAKEEQYQEGSLPELFVQDYKLYPRAALQPHHKIQKRKGQSKDQRGRFAQ